MAYWGWWRRRWPRRRWRRWRRRRRRRIPKRRPRRPVRRYRKRYTVRRRRARGWRGRRRRRLYRRRYVVRRKKKKLTLKTWQPANIRKCRIRGMLPLVICGHTLSAQNYAIHSDDYILQRFPMGGGLSTMSFNLKVLYDQHMRKLNRWSSSNEVLDLARYLGCTWWFYRDKHTDYIVQYDISAPFKLDKNSSPSYHPAIMMQSKHKILVPSFDTHPKGRAKIKVRIQPPKMFVDKWYAQEDLCAVNLVSLAVSLASFTHPFCSPQTDNPCITFQVLQDFYYPIIGHSVNLTDQKVTDVFNNILYKKPEFYQQVLTASYIGIINHNPDGSATVQGANGSPSTTNMSEYNTWVTGTGANKFRPGNTNVHYNFCTYKPDAMKLTNLRKYYFSWEVYKSVATSTSNSYHVDPAHTAPTKDWWEYRIGLFSPIFLSPYRTSPVDNWPTAYRDIVYNPLMDKGVGNKMWYQYLVKQDTQWHPQASIFTLEDMPLYAMAYGYTDFIYSVRGEHDDVDFNGVICVICPYTKPKLYNDKNPQMGYIFYDSQFGNGKWIDNTGFVPVEMQCRWRPCMAFQKKVLTDISMSGPWTYKDELKNTTIQAKYRFDFKWGGNMLYQQTIRNPCTDGQAPAPHRQPRDVQVTDPITMGPRYVFHQWDWRRGFLSDKALKRMLQKPLDADAYPLTPKRPRVFPPTDQEGVHVRGEGYSSEEESSLTSQEEEQTQETLQLQLRKQLRQQRDIRQQLKFMLQQVLKTQAGLHVNPLLFNQL
nr:MAG: ORF1 [Torque teno virus]UGV44184.1 MAG: ORF1 [Torque teno virus]